MSFARAVRQKELAAISTLLALFGVVEERQMRSLFSHLSDAQYGKIMNRLRIEGIVYRSPDSKYLACNQYTFQRADKESCVNCFWAFMCVKDKVQDFCAGEPPALLTIAAKDHDYDLIPVNGKNIAFINTAADEVPERTVRYLVTNDLRKVKGINRRWKNDYVLHVKPDGQVDAYEL